MIVLQPHCRSCVESALRRMPGREYCAFVLEGEHGMQEIFQVLNVDGLRGCFQVPCSELARVEAHAQRHRITIGAFIHSHHSGVHLSAADVRSRARCSYPWIVVHAGPRRFMYKSYPARAQD